MEKLKKCSIEEKNWFSKSPCKTNESYYIIFVKKRVQHEVDFSKMSSQWSLDKDRCFLTIQFLEAIIISESGHGAQGELSEAYVV